MNINNSKINEVIEANSEVIRQIYGDDFGDQTWEQTVENCFFKSVKIISEINQELENQDVNSPINTPMYNSRFAIAFILVSPYFQHFTKSLLLKDGVVEIENIELILNTMSLYLRFAEDPAKTVQLVRHSSFVELGRHYRVVHGDEWPYILALLNPFGDKSELLKAFEESVDQIQSDYTNQAPMGTSLVKLFAFPSNDARVKAGRCYRVWVKSFTCYAMQCGSVSLSERVEKVLSNVINDKKSSDNEHRRRAERLIQCALLREPLINGHANCMTK
ncbi:MAG: hypothetical protein IH613_02725 [Desulfuromonadales bacterium]|nr:hypothetical protein [Desulfuromonadales bacterium]